MSKATIVFESHPEQQEAAPRRMMASIALVSFASLLLELALTRLFSVVLFYHFAFLAISLALLGLGAGGVFAHIGRRYLSRYPTPVLGTLLSTINAFVIVAALEVVLHVPVSLELNRGNFYRLTAIYLVCAVPFFFTGLLFAAVFARESKRVTLLYGADLLGGALACLAVVPVLNFVGGPNAVLLAATAMAAAGALWARTGVDETVGAPGSVGQGFIPDLRSNPVDTNEKNDRALAPARTKLMSGVAVVVAALLLVTIGANYSGRLVDIVYAKGARRDQPWVLFARWNAISRVEVDQQGESKYIVIDADASTAIMNVDPARWAEDKTTPTPHDNGLPSTPAYNWKKDLMAAAPAVTNILRPKGDYAIIGPGGGVDVLRAAANGSQNVTGIEINPIIVNDIMKGRYADYAYHLYELPNVHIHVADGRSYLRASKDKYDVVQMTLVDTWASTAAGAFALSENNLYTTQAFKEYFDHLKPDGIIAITRWEFAQPREALRVVSQEIEALKPLIRDAPKWHFIIVSDGDLNEDGRPVTVLAKKSAFTVEEESAVHQHLLYNRNLYLVYAPNESRYPVIRDMSWDPWWHGGAYQAVDPTRAAKPFADLIVPNPADEATFQNAGRQAFIKRYPYDISSVSDNEPFFFFTLKTRDVIRNVLAGTGKGMDWRINLGIVVLGLLLMLSIAAVLLFLIVPLAVHQIPRRVAPGVHARRAERSSAVLPLMYFVALGVGYILVEVAFIQRFVLFLGHPVYALTVVVFLMLLSSGVGSLAARRLLAETPKVIVVLTLIVGGLIIAVLELPLMLSMLVGLPFAVKLFLTALVIVPLGFFMGMPLPTGLRALAADSSESDDSLIEWAWAMNAAASVLGSVGAMVIAIHLGLNITLATGAVAYLAAIALSLPLLRREVVR